MTQKELLKHIKPKIFNTQSQKLKKKKNIRNTTSLTRHGKRKITRSRWNPSRIVQRFDILKKDLHLAMYYSI